MKFRKFFMIMSASVISMGAIIGLTGCNITVSGPQQTESGGEIKPSESEPNETKPSETTSVNDEVKISYALEDKTYLCDVIVKKGAAVDPVALVKKHLPKGMGVSKMFILNNDGLKLELDMNTATFDKDTVVYVVLEKLPLHNTVVYVGAGNILKPTTISYDTVDELYDKLSVECNEAFANNDGSMLVFEKTDYDLNGTAAKRVYKDQIVLEDNKELVLTSGVAKKTVNVTVYMPETKSDGTSTNMDQIESSGSSTSTGTSFEGETDSSDGTSISDPNHSSSESIGVSHAVVDTPFGVRGSLVAVGSLELSSTDFYNELESFIKDELSKIKFDTKDLYFNKDQIVAFKSDNDIVIRDVTPDIIKDDFSSYEIVIMLGSTRI